MRIFIIILIATIPVALLIHYLVGNSIKKKLKSGNHYEGYLEFNKEYRKNRTLKDRLTKLIFLVPILNVLLAIAEISNRDACFLKLVKEIKKFEKEQKKLTIVEDIEDAPKEDNNTVD